MLLECVSSRALILSLLSEPRVMTRGLILLRGAEPVVEVYLDKKNNKNKAFGE